MEEVKNKVEEDNWVVGAEWADSLGVQVINSSLGYTKFDDTTKTEPMPKWMVSIAELYRSFLFGQKDDSM